jgi:hypothetical protein
MFGTGGSKVNSEYHIQGGGTSWCQDTKHFGRIKLLGNIEDVAAHTPASVGESAEWATIVNAAEENGVSYCKALRGKPLLVPCMELIL